MREEERRGCHSEIQGDKSGHLTPFMRATRVTLSRDSAWNDRQQWKSASPCGHTAQVLSAEAF